MSDAVATVPTTGHELLLALAGRIDDDLLAIGRELVAVGEEAVALELVVASLAAARAVLPYPVRDGLANAVERRMGPDLVRSVPQGAPLPDRTPHRFSTDAGAPEVAARIGSVVTGLPVVARTGARTSLAWRLTPAGAAPGPVPHPVVLAVLDGPGSAEVLAYQVGAALARAGIPASVEAFADGEALPAYHRAALAVARPFDPAGADPASAPPPAAVAPTSAAMTGTTSTGPASTGVAPTSTVPSGDALFAAHSEAPKVTRAPYDDLDSLNLSRFTGAPGPAPGRTPDTGGHPVPGPASPRPGPPGPATDPGPTGSGAPGLPDGTGPATSPDDAGPPASANDAGPASPDGADAAVSPNGLGPASPGGAGPAVSLDHGDPNPSGGPAPDPGLSGTPDRRGPAGTHGPADRADPYRGTPGPRGPGNPGGPASGPRAADPLDGPAPEVRPHPVPSSGGPSSTGTTPPPPDPAVIDPARFDPARNGANETGPQETRHGANGVPPHPRPGPVAGPRAVSGSGPHPSPRPAPRRSVRPGPSGTGGFPGGSPGPETPAPEPPAPPRPSPRPAEIPPAQNGHVPRGDEQAWSADWNNGSWSMPGGLPPDPDIEPATSPTPSTPAPGIPSPAPRPAQPPAPESPASESRPPEARPSESRPPQTREPFGLPGSPAPFEPGSPAPPEAGPPAGPRPRHRLDTPAPVERPDPLDPATVLPPVSEQGLDSRLTPNEQELLRKLQQELAARENGTSEPRNGTAFPPEMT